MNLKENYIKMYNRLELTIEQLPDKQRSMAWSIFNKVKKPEDIINDSKRKTKK